MAASYTAVFAPEAAAEVTAIAAWWHKNRQAAPGLFQQELEQALLNIAAYPEIGVRAKMPADLGAAKNLHVEIYDVVVHQFAAVPAAPDAVGH